MIQRGFTMTDLPQRVLIQEEGPREGFQIEPKPISVADKVSFIEALAEHRRDQDRLRLVRQPGEGAVDGRRRGGGGLDHQA